VKVKTSFVTNSSSSSFIVAWDKIVKTFDDVKEHLTYTEHARIVLKDILDQEPIVLKQGNFDFDLDPVLKGITNRVIEELMSGTFQEDVSWEEYDRLIKTRMDIQQVNKIFESKRRRGAEQVASEFVKKNIGKVLYFFTYSDEDGGIYSDMEHGDIFGELSNIRISHH